MTINNVGVALLKVGRFLRLVDEHYPQISIVNIACLVVIIKVAVSVNPSMFDLGALLTGLLAHYGKKQMNIKIQALDEQQTKDIAENKKRLQELADRVGSLAAALGFKNLKS